MATLSSGDVVDLFVSSGEPRVHLYVEDNVSVEFSSTDVWLTPDEARAFAARIVDVADSIDRLE